MPMPEPIKTSPMKKPGHMDQMMGDTGTTKLNIKDYPQLQGVQQGQKVTGSFEATVESIDGDAVNLSFETIDMNSENSADRELKKMTGKSDSPQQKEEEEEAY